MGLAAWLNLDAKDVVAFFVSGVIGYFAGSLVPPGTWAILTSVLISYHLFLAWLVITAENSACISLPISSTVATHLACLTLIVPPALMGHFIPFFGIFRYGIAALAIFERGWLFTASNVQYGPKESPANSPIVTDTAEDFQEWTNYLATQGPTHKAGRSIKEEYSRWLLARAQNRPAAPSNDKLPDGS
jgi:hypothetical protein